MPRPQKEPLRPLSPDEHAWLDRMSRSHTAPAAQVARAKARLAVAAGHRFTEAAHLAGRQSGAAVAQLVARCNRAGLAALTPGHGGGQPQRYTQREQARILQAVQRTPDREVDGRATWSLTTRQRALRQAPDGLPGISTATIWGVRHGAGFTWGKDRSWCQTGTALRVRTSGPVLVTAPDTSAKQT